MLQTKLFQLLATLSEEEWARFHAFVHSPYHNRSNKAVELCELLFPHFPIAANEEEEPGAKREKALAREVLSKAVFPDKSPESSNLDNLFNTVKKLIFSFLSIEKYVNDERAQSLALLTDLGQRAGAELFFEKNWKSEAKACEKQEGSSLELFHHQLQLQNRWLTYTVLTGDREKAFPIEKALTQLQHYTLTAQLKYALGALNRHRLVGKNAEIPFLEAALSQVKASPDLLEIPIMALYYRLLICYLEPEKEEAYQALECDVARFMEKIDASEKGEIYAAHINYLIGRWRSGSGSLDKIFAVYKASDESGGLVVNGAIQAGNYLNVVDVGLSLARAAKGDSSQKEIRSWIETFVERRFAQLNESVRQAVRDQAQALLHYEDKNYTAASQCLLESRSDLMMEIGRRVLLQKVYFDMGDEELFSALLAANLLFMHRKKDRLSAFKHQAYSLFFRTVDKLFKLKYEPAQGAEKLRLLIEQAEVMESRNWLMARVLVKS